MITKYVLPLLSVLGLTFAIGTVLLAQSARGVVADHRTAEPADRVQDDRRLWPDRSEAREYPDRCTVPGVVWEVFVKIGDKVKAGEPLFRLDERELQAQIKVRAASLAAAQAQLHKAQAAPRAEDIPPARAAVEEAKAKLNDAECAMARTEKLYNRQMAPASDYDHDRFTYYSARAGAGAGCGRPR